MTSVARYDPKPIKAPTPTPIIFPTPGETEPLLAPTTAPDIIDLIMITFPLIFDFQVQLHNQ